MNDITLALDKAKMEWLKRMNLTLKDNWLYRLGGWIFTFHLVAFCWVFFRASSFENASSVLHQIASNFNAALFIQVANGYKAVFLLLLLGYLIHFIPASFEDRIKKVITLSPAFVQAALMALMIYIVYQTRSAEVQPFIYFQF